MSAPPLVDDALQALRVMAWYGQRKPTFTGGNDITLLKRGSEQFPAQCACIDQAKQSVWMATYLVSAFGQSGAVLQALMRAARRGVDVRFVVDGIGSREVAPSLWREMEQAGVHLEVYRPVRGPWSLLDTTQWRRMHLKLCAVDEEVAFIGGINLIDDRYDLARGWAAAPRLDYALQVRGPAVMPIAHTIEAVWTRASLGRDWRDDLAQWVGDGARLRRLRALWRKSRLKLVGPERDRLAAASAARAPMRCAFVLRDNLLQRRTIEHAALQAIQQARQRVDIVTPYFYPARALRHALREAAGRGVHVRLLLQGRLVDYRIAAIAARVLYAGLQRHGVHIHEYQAAFLHAKVALVDDDWATVGSSNLDPLSLVLNLEANLVVRDQEFVKNLSTALDADFSQSVEVPMPARPDQRWSTRVRRQVVAWMAKVYLRLAGVTGRY